MGAMNPLEKSFLIQRLQQPFQSSKEPVVFPEGFDYVTEMLSDKSPKTLASNIREKIYQLDYMGSSEFEWGIIPQTLRKISGEVSEYGAFTLTVKFKDMDRPYRYKGGIEENREFTIFTICRRDQSLLVEARIRELCNETKYKIHLKENTYLVHALIAAVEEEQLKLVKPAKPKGKGKKIKKEEGEFSGYLRYGGWLELESAFFFFTSKLMFDGVARLFKVKLNP